MALSLRGPLLLPLLLAWAGCRGVAPTDPDLAGAPDWVHVPSSFDPSLPEEVLLVVGRSKSTDGDPRREAQMDAQVRLLEVSGLGDYEMTLTRKNGKTSMRFSIEGTIGPVRILAHWTAPDGTVFALARMDPGERGSVGPLPGEPAGSR